LANVTSRLSATRQADYAVRQEAAWKKDVWRTAFVLPSRMTPRRCVRPSAAPWLILTIRVGARVTAGPRAAVTSWSSNASIGRPTTGTSRVSSSATCEWMTICPSTMSAPRATRRRPGWCAICSTRPSIRSGPRSRKSRSAATRRSGWISFAVSRVSISRARNIADPITGPSGAGTASGPEKTNSWPNRLRLAPRRQALVRRRRRPTARPNAGRRLHDVRPPVRRGHRGPVRAHREAAVVLKETVARRVRRDRAVVALKDQVDRDRRDPVVRHDEVLDPWAATALPPVSDRPIHAESVTRPTRQGGGA
jgi:hypothetical protein